MMLLYKPFIYCFMLLVYVTYCITSKDINPEELARRRKVAESYLSERAEAEKDWIETYHLSYEISKDISIVTHESKPKPVMQNKRDAHFEHMKIMEDSVKLHTPHFSDEKYENHFDNSYDFSATEAESRLDKDEYVRRRSIYASFLPKLATLEKEDSELAYAIYKSKISHKKSVYSAKSTVENKKKSTKEKNNVKKMQQLTEHDIDNIHRFEISNNNELFQSHEYDRSKLSPENVLSSTDSENSQLFSESSNLKSSSNIDTISDQLKDQLIISNSIINEEQIMPHDNINNEKSEAFSKSSVPISKTEPGVIISEVDGKDYSKKSADDGNELDLGDGKSYLNSKSEKSLANESLNENKNVSASSHMFQGNITNNETMNVLNESNMETIKAVDSDASIKTGSPNKKVNNPSTLNKCQGDVSKNTVSVKNENSDSVLKTDYSTDNANFDKVTIKPNIIKNSENIKAIDSDTSIKTGVENKKVIDPSDLNKRQGDVSKNTVHLNDENSDSVLKTDHFDQIKVKPETMKNSDIHNHVDLKLLQRQKTAKSYLSALEEEQKDWVETYHLSYSEGDRKKNNYFHSKNTDVSTEKIYNSPENIDVVYENSRKMICPETQYFNRWTKKLINKFENYPVNTFSSLTFSFSDKLINHLEKLSSLEDFDITVFDELICGLISNATVHNPFPSTFFNKLYSFITDIYTNYLPSLSTIFTFLFVILLLIIFIYIPRSRWLLIVVGILIWHYIKMYQEKIAEKQAIISDVSPAHCENILTRESGIFAYVKEYFRRAWHGDDCRKYYAAVMIDPMAELSLPIVAADLASSIMFQMLKPLGPTMNTFFKDSLYGLSWVQTLFFIVLLCVVLWFCLLFFSVFRNYKLKLPFSLGSAEPTAFSIKNRVEDVILDDDKHYLQNSAKEPCEGENRILAEESCKCSPTKVVENISKIEERVLDTQDVVSVSPTKPDVSLIAYTVQGKNIIFVDKLISNEKISPVTHKLPTRMSSDNFVHDAYNSFKRRSSF